VVESALRSRRLTSKELGHVIMCAYGAPRAGIFNGRVLRDVPSRGQCLTCCVPASHSSTETECHADERTSSGAVGALGSLLSASDVNRLPGAGDPMRSVT